MQRSSIAPQELKKRKRERLAIALIFAAFLFLTYLEIRLSHVSQSLPFVNSIFFFGLINVNVILLIALFWLIFRNIGKLFWERRNRVLGAHLKTKLVVAFLTFSIVPTLILFAISSFYINSSFDKWFSIKIQNTLQSSLEITRTYYLHTDQTAAHFASHLAEEAGHRFSLNGQKPLFPQLPKGLEAYLRQNRSLLALNAIEYYANPLDPRLIVREETENPESLKEYPRVPLDVLTKAFQGQGGSMIQHLQNGDLIRATAPIFFDSKKSEVLGVIVTNQYIPVSLVNKVDEIAHVIDDYKVTNPLQYPIKTTYFAILVMVTLVVMFVAIWLGLYFARELTVPIERLARGSRAVGSGNLDVQIPVSGEDEVATLIQSFNKMTRDLKQNREHLTQATKDLEKRRVQLEAILAHIGAGVIGVDKMGTIITFNNAASKLLELDLLDSQGRHFKDALHNSNEVLIKLIETAIAPTEISPHSDSLTAQWTCKTSTQSRQLAAMVTTLREGKEIWGAVAVVDDMSHFLKAQREVAWREVARRIAHEIKNPLTPIKLSAQRLQRRFANLTGKNAELLLECTNTIVQHTDELKEMVNEFSNFARFPAIAPESNDLNQVLQEVLGLYASAHSFVEFQFAPERRLPAFEFDRDQIKRVFINLLDNSVAALQASPSKNKKLVAVESHYNEKLRIAAVSVDDNGPGIPDEAEERIFEPYFSTKKEGTGLGLAIAKRIVNDHDGFIRIVQKSEQGARFLVELPTQAKPDIRRSASFSGGETLEIGTHESEI